MKLSVLVFCLLSASVLFSQERNQADQVQEMYQWSVQCFQEEEYALSYRHSESLLYHPSALSPSQLESLRYVMAASSFYLNRLDASCLLKQFLTDFPLSVNAPNAYFLLGTCAINAAQYQDALEMFSLCHSSNLSRKEYEDHRFRKAYLLVQLNRYEEADSLFQILFDEQGRYVQPATYYMAYIDYVQGRTDEALAGFLSVSEIEEYQQTVPFFVMQIYFTQGRYRQLLTMAEELLQKDPNESERIELYRLSGAGYYELNNHQSSQDFYERYLSYQPELLRTDAYRIAMNHFLEKNYTEALRYFSKVCEADDALAQNAIYHIGVCYLQQQKTDLARMSFERAAMNNYDLAAKESALYNYALLCYETSFSPFNEQVRAFERILNEFPQSRYADQVYSHLADAFLSSGNYQASIDFINKIDRPTSNMLVTKSKLLFLLGVEKFKNNDFTEANALFTSSLELARTTNSPTAEIYFWRAECAYRLQSLQAAANDYKRFLSDKDAKHYQAYQIAHYNLAYCYFNSRLYADAITWFSRYTNFNELSSEDSYYDALSRMGDAYYYRRDYQQAERCYQTSDKLKPQGNDYAVYQQAFCLGLRRQYAEKALLLDQFEKRFPSSDYLPQALYEQARAYVALQKSQPAIVSLDKLISRFPQNELARKAGIQKGLLYYNMNEVDKAIAAYKQVVAAYPGSSEARTAVNDMKSIYVSINRVQDYVTYVNGLGEAFKLKSGEQDSLMYTAAELLVMERKHDDALYSFRSYLKEYPQGRYACEANYYCATLLYDKHQVNESVPYFEQVLTYKGSVYVPKALDVLSEYALINEDYDQALLYYNQLETATSDKQLRLNARFGKMQCYAATHQQKELLLVAESLLAESNLSPDRTRMARYYRIQSLLAMNRSEETLKDMEILAKESQTIYGAEVRYQLADYWYHHNKLEKAEEMAQSFLREGTPHAYWMARCFILLSDIYMQRNDDFQARQYLLSLKENYKTQDDIQDMIVTRLATIAERNQETPITQ